MIDSMSFGADGQIQLMAAGVEAKPRDAIFAELRGRRKGPKTLVSVPLDPARMSFGTLPTLNAFRNIFFVDANTRPGGQGMLSAAAFAIGRVSRAPYNQWHFQCATVGTMMIYNCHGRAENLAWSVLQSMMIAGHNFSSEDQYAIVTDSDLGNHSSYNSRQAPIYRDTFLQPNVRLLYASADSGRDVLNLGIRDCDKLARQYLVRFDQGDLAIEDLAPVLDGPCDRFKVYAQDGPLPVEWLRLGLSLPFQLV